jgi:hypothetical protein
MASFQIIAAGPTFLGLPLEIRILIYAFVLCWPDTIQLCHIGSDDGTPYAAIFAAVLCKPRPYKLRIKASCGRRKSPLPEFFNLLLTCRQCSNEVPEVFYGGNTFTFSAWPSEILTFLTRIPEDLRSKIRALRFVSPSMHTKKYTQDLDDPRLEYGEDPIRGYQCWWKILELMDGMKLLNSVTAEMPMHYHTGCYFWPVIRNLIARATDGKYGGRLRVLHPRQYPRRFITGTPRTISMIERLSEIQNLRKPCWEMKNNWWHGRWEGLGQAAAWGQLDKEIRKGGGAILKFSGRWEMGIAGWREYGCTLVLEKEDMKRVIEEEDDDDDEQDGGEGDSKGKRRKLSKEEKEEEGEEEKKLKLKQKMWIEDSRLIDLGGDLSGERVSWKMVDQRLWAGMLPLDELD